MSSQEEVLCFLEKWKESIKNGIDFVKRDKNLESLKELKISKKFAIDILANLELKNYSSGPQADESSLDQEVWIFGFDFMKKEIYIKIKVYWCQNTWRGKCISFHQAEKHLFYPFK